MACARLCSIIRSCIATTIVVIVAVAADAGIIVAVVAIVVVVVILIFAKAKFADHFAHATTLLWHTHNAKVATAVARVASQWHSSRRIGKSTKQIR